MGFAAQKQEQNRQPHHYEDRPSPESIKIFAGLASPVASLMIVADGKQMFFSITRKQMLGIAAEVYAGLRDMEPGK